MLSLPVNQRFQPRPYPPHSRSLPILHFAHPLTALPLGVRAFSPHINSAPCPRYLGSPHPSRMPLAGACGDSLLFHGPRITGHGSPATVFRSFCFHALTNCPICKLFVFTFMHAMGGCVPPSSPKKGRTHEQHNG